MKENRIERRIEDYALLGDGRSCALVHRDGSIDWMCWPRMDSSAMFCALLGSSENGHWTLRPTNTFSATRSYLEGTLILQTLFQAPGRQVRVCDWLAEDSPEQILFRRLECLEGEVEMQMEFAPKYDYGSIRPWIHQTENGYRATAGPDCCEIRSSVHLEPTTESVKSRFTIKKGEVVEFSLSWQGFHGIKEASQITATESLAATAKKCRSWLGSSKYQGPHRALVERSLLTLKALVDIDSGAMVAAPTTSLPELIGGERNWDYRYCWIRDATYTMFVFLSAGYTEEAKAWQRWLVRAVAGTPETLNIMYGLRGERRLTEMSLDWLDGFRGSKPVRTGNAAYMQRQLDIYGELMDTLHLARKSGLHCQQSTWVIQKDLLQFLETAWTEPDEGIWESRGEPQRYTHSQVMAWVAFDRAVRDAEDFDLDGDIEKWRNIRDRIHTEVCEKGFSKKLNSFTQYFGSSNVDASLLLLCHVGFLPANDPRILGTIERIESELMSRGFLRRYHASESPDGLDGDDGVFLACSFWLVDAYVLSGQREKAEALFANLTSLVNDVGLLSEEYDSTKREMLGNFPQALSHLSLVNSAFNLGSDLGPARLRSSSGPRGD